MNSQAMMRTTAKPRHLFTNVAAVGAAPDWREVPRPVDFDAAGDPNSFIYANTLFGYAVPEFLAKQYR